MIGRYYQLRTGIYKALVIHDEKAWLIDYQSPRAPFPILERELNFMEQLGDLGKKGNKTYSTKMQNTMQKRLMALKPLLDDETCIYDEKRRKELACAMSTISGYSIRRIYELYYMVLAYGKDALYTKKREHKENANKKNIRWAINKYYFSSYRASLKQAYAMMLMEKYSDTENPPPSFSQFYYYYHKDMRDSVKKEISRNGITHYQQNHRPLYGRAEQDVDSIGTYQMDATDADIHLVSSYNRALPIGRPKIYLAVDTASHLIAGVYVGLEGGENAVIQCLKQATMDKVEYCSRYGIEISPDEWPSKGVPQRIVTDQGGEFVGKRMDELCRCYGITREATPPYRPDRKGLVERAFLSIQNNFKYLLRHKGVIEEGYQEKGIPSYVREASLTLKEFTAVVIHCILKINNTAVLNSLARDNAMAQRDVPPVASKVWEWYESCGKTALTPVSDDEINKTMLEEGYGKFTRKGLVFRDLSYFRDGYHSRCARAGMDGAQKVKVAYDSLCTDHIYLIEDGQYIRFDLTPSKERYADSSYTDVSAFLKEERANKRRFQQKELEQSVEYIRKIKMIAKQADDERDGLIDTAQIKRLKEIRDMEKGDIVF